MDSNQMKQWAKAKNPFLKLNDGESIIAVLKSARAITKDSFGQEKEVIRYQLMTDEGQEKVFENGSPALAAILADFMGQRIALTRHGEGTKTRYEVKPSNGKPTANPDGANKPEEVKWEE